MVANLPFRLKNFRIYLTSLLFIFLAALYFGGFLLVIFAFFLIFPLLSILLTLASSGGLNCFQILEIRKPVKGQTVQYKLTFNNISRIPITQLKGHFHTLEPGITLSTEGLPSYLRGAQSFEKDFPFYCEYRGSYTIGIDYYEIEDPLRMVTLRRRVPPLSLQVYPRIQNIDAFTIPAMSLAGDQEHTVQDGDPDYSLFRELRDYRDGQSIRFMHWKRFASHGKPYLKDFEMTGQMSLHIYLDVRPTGKKGVDSLKVEDTSVEILTSLVKHLLDRGVPIQVNASTSRTYRFRGNHTGHFENFYKSTPDIRFHNAVHPANLFRADLSTDSIGMRSFILITHLVDQPTFQLLEDSLASGNIMVLIFNQSGCTAEEIEKNRTYFQRLREKGAKIVIVNSADTIPTDMR